jgi:hypothetical protein
LPTIISAAWRRSAVTSPMALASVLGLRSGLRVPPLRRDVRDSPSHHPPARHWMKVG